MPPIAYAIATTDNPKAKATPTVPTPAPTVPRHIARKNGTTTSHQDKNHCPDHF